ncbi:MAG: DEAD/DEAH box helicase [Solirubrobacteraceae bacterium]|nr:DEAD/DEAH box helicase [Solirubrobacteraceae bacterium]
MAVTTASERPWTELLARGRGEGTLVHQAREGARAPRFAPIPHDLNPALRAALAEQGMGELYEHQAAAIEAAWHGATITTTGTASGKSLCYLVPTAEVLLGDPRARALYLAPTKALAQDQARRIHQLGLKALRPAIYDGDTPKEQRTRIRREANIILTNPDMLHVGVLPNHAAWHDLFANLAVVVIDEAHVYRGVFGSHVGNVLRRLRRLAARYGTEPRFLMASATIGNPVELGAALTGIDEIALVDDDASPQAPRQYAMWDPPLLDEDSGARRSAVTEAAEIVVDLVKGGARVICFMKARKGVEMISRMVVEQLEDSAPMLASKVSPYRAGYTPEQRRDIEAKLTRGELRAVIATNALELGIDIGALDACVVVTFPGTVASLKQQWGRAGRRTEGLALYVAGDDALDQYFCRNPEQFLDRPVENAILDPFSEQIHAQHLLCAALEAPIVPEDLPFFGPKTPDAIAELIASGGLVKRPSGYVLAEPDSYPASKTSLRSASAEQIVVVNGRSGEVMGGVELGRAFSTVHKGAVYFHLGKSYLVRDLDVVHGSAVVDEFDGEWYTQPKTETTTTIDRLLERRDVPGAKLSFGEVSVTETVIGYQRKRYGDHEAIDLIALDLPTTTFSTQALWYEPTHEAMRDLPMEALLGALHAAEHTQIAVLPLLAMCDRWDIGGLSTNLHMQTAGPTIFIYDGHPGGIGITREGYRRFEELCLSALTLLKQCPCEHGCPSCVQSPKCGNLNEPLSKAGSIMLLEGVLGVAPKLAPAEAALRLVGPPKGPKRPIA